MILEVFGRCYAIYAVIVGLSLSFFFYKDCLKSGWGKHTSTFLFIVSVIFSPILGVGYGFWIIILSPVIFCEYLDGKYNKTGIDLEEK